MSHRRTLRRTLLAAAISTALAAPLLGASQASAGPQTLTGAPVAAQQPTAENPFDHVDRRGAAPTAVHAENLAPGGGVAAGRIPGDVARGDGPRPEANAAADAPAQPPHALDGAVPCTLDGIAGLSPDRFADFLADPAVTVDGCLSGLIWTWDARLAPVMSDAHVQTVARRITALAPNHDGRNGSNLYEMFTYLHAVAYHDFSREEIDLTDPPTVAAVRDAVHAFGEARRTFRATRSNADTLREALYAASAEGLRHHQLGLIQKVLATMGEYHGATYADPAWGGAALAALSVNYLGVYPGNQDTAFHDAVAGDPYYRQRFMDFVDHTHLVGTPNEWTVRDALSEYARFGQIDSLRDEIVNELGWLLGQTVRNYGKGSEPWAKIASWLNHYDACKPYNVCIEDIEKELFPHTYLYDNGTIRVRTGLDRAVVDQLYYASKQVRAQFHRVVGSTEPLAGDVNDVLNIVLYASRADYETYHPLLTGMGTNNGGIYIERGATFYTYQRRVPQDSSLTLEELFRHEYVHYLNGRFAVPGYFGEGAWYRGDRTTAMDEGTAEFFDGATRDEGIAVRKSLVRSIIDDTAGGGPRMSVNRILHATYDGDGFRFYSYAGAFFEYLWQERPSLIQEMYRHLRADDPAAFDAWRTRLGSDAALQRGYDAFLDAQIAKVDELFTPDTTYVPGGELRYATAAEVRAAFASATYNTPECEDNGDTSGKARFVCTGRITANLSDSGDPNRVFKDMSETVDYFILDRSLKGGNNFNDMNCSFGPVDIWPSGRAGTSGFSCEGPLRR
ncbi:collagenase [Streptomyces sp. MUM 178J]|uniref:collagenase n=1 Tax=Streptomyces sp. MUM 178J TaxID=2791991 RepID=UPI001F03F72C|nr:collagenase [Streptomyces sp. MUM 178J]WRQ80655.1 collagenase [Streptomyces sp. MUM 178J]